MIRSARLLVALLTILALVSFALVAPGGASTTRAHGQGLPAAGHISSAPLIAGAHGGHAAHRAVPAQAGHDHGVTTAIEAGPGAQAGCGAHCGPAAAGPATCCAAWCGLACGLALPAAVDLLVATSGERIQVPAVSRGFPLTVAPSVPPPRS